MSDDGFHAVEVPALATLPGLRRPGKAPARARKVLVAGSLMVALSGGMFGLGRSLAGDHEANLGTGVAQTADSAQGQDTGSTTVDPAPAGDEGSGGEPD